MSNFIIHCHPDDFDSYLRKGFLYKFTYGFQSTKPENMHLNNSPVTKIGFTHSPRDRLRKIANTGLDVTFSKLWLGTLADIKKLELEIKKILKNPYYKNQSIKAKLGNHSSEEVWFMDELTTDKIVNQVIDINWSSTVKLCAEHYFATKESDDVFNTPRQSRSTTIAIKNRETTFDDVFDISYGQ